MKALGQILIGFLLLAGAVNGRSFVRMCYYNGRRGNYYQRDDPSIMNPGQIDPSLCTDVVWAHGYIDTAKKTISACRVGDSHCQGLFKKFQSFRAKHPELFFAMSIDGVDVRSGVGEKQQQQQQQQTTLDPIEYYYLDIDFEELQKNLQQQQRQQQSHKPSRADMIRTFGSVSQNDSDRHTFATNVVKYLKDRHMDGLVIDWEFPTKASNTDTLYVELLKRLHTKFSPRNAGGQGMFLAVTLANLPWQVMVSYDVKQVHPHVDYLIVKCYDYHLQGNGPDVLSFSSPLFSQSPENITPSLSSTLMTYIYLMDVPAQKIVVGLSWKATRYLWPQDSVLVPGSPGKLDTTSTRWSTLKEGFTYPEACSIKYRIQGAQHFYDKQQEAPYAVLILFWIGFEDHRSVATKMKFIGQLGVAGVMVSDVGLDDFKGLLCKRGKFPLLNTIKEEAAVVGLGMALNNGDDRVRCASCYGVTAPVAMSLLAAFIRLLCY